MNRRGFLSSILALAAAPAIVRADSLMRIVPVEAEVLVPMTEFSTEFSVVSRIGNSLMTLDEIASAALAIAHERYKFIKAINVATDAAYDEYTDSTTYRTRILIPGRPEKKPDPQGDTIKIRFPNRYRAA